HAAAGWSDDEAIAPTLDMDPRTMPAYAVASRSFLVVDDLGREERFGAGPDLTSQGVRSGITLLIQWRDSKVWGAICAYARSPRAYTEDQTSFLQALANLA